MARPDCRAHTKTGNPCKRKAAAGSAYCGSHGGATRPIGRPTKLTYELIGQIASVVETGVAWEVAAQAVGVHERTLLEWRHRGEEEDATGRDSVYAQLHRELMRARAVGEERLVEVIRKAAPDDWRAGAWLLERSRPERWAKNAKVDVTLNDAAKPRDVEPGEGKRDEVLRILRDQLAPPAGTE